MTPQSLKALVVDDDRNMRESLVELLESAGWQAEGLASARQVGEALERLRPDAIVSDVRMPGMSGLELLESLSGTEAPPMILISAHGDIPMAVEAIQAGAYTFLEKPFDPRRLLTALSHAAEQHRLRLGTARLKARLARLSGLDRILLGRTPAMTALREMVQDLAETPTTVLLHGETGTGKDLVAHALHDLSPRSDAPFMALSCATLPAEHFESTLFGHGGQPGLLARAHGGTLFLDEIAACPPDVQSKLLRVIETREFHALDDPTPRRVDFRLLSATNEDLEAAVAAGRFRGDLLYRINTVVLSLPALRERADDIPLLFAHFTGLCAALYESAQPELTPSDIAALLAHDWPGNVRELRNVAERFVLARRRAETSLSDVISAQGAPQPAAPNTLREAVAAFEREMIAKALKAHGGRMDEVAEALGIGRRTLNEKIVKLGLNKDAVLVENG
ncbi:C4-dicarboxylate transport transcriptional regulatory protein DctD [Pseudoruegeria aquimaris]|uniref:Nif-specific regulatory protein n=1 Tax=Pseudoruegeria aquimaris TaxID=393663 RepID=A0A1Y5R6N7_9RHOB|nr:sigma-54 dependent transcriptional regulator [Pseudoruegeria aquimaris]SLN10476.1 C4-dicarboxylate transport transcriptional regulatory protein DctD [Pseudoruegeria aquimaris]